MMSEERRCSCGKLTDCLDGEIVFRRVIKKQFCSDCYRKLMHSLLDFELDHEVDFIVR